jgi:hypothetical protein
MNKLNISPDNYSTEKEFLLFCQCGKTINHLIHTSYSMDGSGKFKIIIYCENCGRQHNIPTKETLQEQRGRQDLKDPFGTGKDYSREIYKTVADLEAAVLSGRWKKPLIPTMLPKVKVRGTESACPKCGSTDVQEAEGEDTGYWVCNNCSCCRGKRWFHGW